MNTMSHTKYNWERLNGYVEHEQWNVQIDQRRRKADADKLSAKGKSKGAKIARCQSIADALPEQFMKIASIEARKEYYSNRKAERIAHRQAKKANRL